MRNRSLDNIVCARRQYPNYADFRIIKTRDRAQGWVPAALANWRWKERAHAGTVDASAALLPCARSDLSDVLCSRVAISDMPTHSQTFVRDGSGWRSRVRRSKAADTKSKTVQLSTST